MQKVGEFWVPDIDVAPGGNRKRTQLGFEGRGGVQISHLERALEFVSTGGVAIDGGANVGAWTKLMGQCFKAVHSFEPNPVVFECLSRNIDEWGLADVVTAYPKGISDRTEYVAIGTSDGARTVTGKIVGAGEIECVSLDSLNLPECSFIKLDLEGYEPQGLMGAKATIARFRPWILIENKPRRLEKLIGTRAVRILKGYGYRLVEKIGDDKIDWLFAPL